jgi:hypothetical protein
MRKAMKAGIIVLPQIPSAIVSLLSRRMLLRIEFALRFGDLLRYNVMHQFLSVTTQLFFLAAGPGVIIFFAEKGESVLAVAARAGVAYLAVWLVQLVYLVTYFLALNKKTMLGHRVLELRDDGLHEETRFNKSLHYWPGILKAVRRPGFIAVYVTGLTAHVIPDRVFSDDIAREKFWTALQFRLARRA